MTYYTIYLGMILLNCCDEIRHDLLLPLCFKYFVCNYKRGYELIKHKFFLHFHAKSAKRFATTDLLFEYCVFYRGPNYSAHKTLHIYVVHKEFIESL